MQTNVLMKQFIGIHSKPLNVYLYMTVTNKGNVLFRREKLPFQYVSFDCVAFRFVM